MAIYTDLALVNPSGVHTFPASLLLSLPGYEIGASVPHPSGELVDIQRSTGQHTVVASNILIHRNGRVGPRNLALDTIVIPIQLLSGLPQDLQAALAALEILPEGFQRI